METVEELEIKPDYSLPVQFAKMMIATSVAFIAGKFAENAFDKVLAYRRNKTMEIN